MAEQQTTEKSLTAKALAKMLSLSKRQIFRLNSCGKIPAPIRIGGSVRWSAQERAEWLAAGAPDRKTSERIQKVGKGPRRKIKRQTSEDLKERLGELLLYLQSPLTEDERKKCWRTFELKLREYLSIKRPHQ